MTFSPQFLDELRTRVGLADVVSRRVKLTRKGREHSGLCPFHKEKTPSFTVNEEKGFYHCFGCGAHGSAIDFVMNTDNLSFPETVERLAAEAGMEVPNKTSIEMNKRQLRSLSNKDIASKVELLQGQLIGCATGCKCDEEEFKKVRKELLQEEFTKKRLPPYVKECRDLFQFWEFIKHEYGTYAERRRYIWGGFSPILNELESNESESLEQAPSDEGTSIVLREFDETHVFHIWSKAVERRSSDPEGAITIARTLLETVCKHILEERSVVCPNNADLPKLYCLTAETLNLAPSEHTEIAFKTILGACQNIVNNLGTLRNRISDAHGQGRRPVKPKPRHAELAVNLAGSMATFLISTWRERYENSQDNLRVN